MHRAAPRRFLVLLSSLAPSATDIMKTAAAPTRSAAQKVALAKQRGVGGAVCLTDALHRGFMLCLRACLCQARMRFLLCVDEVGVSHNHRAEQRMNDTWKESGVGPTKIALWNFMVRQLNQKKMKAPTVE